MKVMKLFIVESPVKAKTIRKFLGKEFIVKATAGHIRDLPSKELGIEEESLKAKYVYVKGKKKLVEDLKKLAKKCKEVYIGTDPDREGETIAFFVREEIRKVNPNIKRAIFFEITPKAIKESIRKAGDINMNLVYAQFARRILDRLIGYKVSPHLWRTFRSFRLSAGRVQSPALRLIVEREMEIREFKPKTYYYVKAVFNIGENKLEAVYDYRYENPSDAQIILEKIKKGIFRVSEIDVKKEAISPPKPFITSSLQAEANSLLGFSPEKTQSIAQRLYEEGFITYPRTDSYRMNEEKAKEFIEYIRKNYGGKYAGKIRQFKDAKLSQGAHECIRPVSLYVYPEEKEQKLLYDLILKRTLASLMSACEVERIKVYIEVLSPYLKESITMVAKMVRVLFKGWTLIYPYDIEENYVGNIKEGDILKAEDIFIDKKRTQPPPRYTEGSLVKTLEKLGIGRPSTYAMLTGLLKKRGYVRLNKRSLVPSDVAFEVIDYLKENFHTLMEYSFTADMERKLDEIEEGKRNWKEVVKEIKNKVLPYD